MVVQLYFENDELEGKFISIGDNLKKVQINNENVLRKYYKMDRKRTIKLLSIFQQMFPQSVSESFYGIILNEPVKPNIF